MTKYDYESAVIEDIRKWIKDNPISGMTFDDAWQMIFNEAEWFVCAPSENPEGCLLGNEVLLEEVMKLHSKYPEDAEGKDSLIRYHFFGKDAIDFVLDQERS